MTVMVNRRLTEFIVNTGSPVTLILPNEVHYNKHKLKWKNRYQDVNKNEVKLIGRTEVTTENDGTDFKLLILITDKVIRQVREMNCLREFKVTNKIEPKATNREEMTPTFRKLFKTIMIKEDMDERMIDTGTSIK